MKSVVGLTLVDNASAGTNFNACFDVNQRRLSLSKSLMFHVQFVRLLLLTML